ncbi:uncharacterized protein [Diadema antillarum]|uniref:uncharacterized protein n=1 Tax=Diadema antillarum TaxID=105358 RepID=UPI003A887550
MGHGASTSVKRVSLAQKKPRVEREEEEEEDSRPVWTRSNSDGCIVESLNTSKTKLDLLEQQITEFKELFRQAELKYEEEHERATTLEKQLAEVEGTNFELTDQISDLEGQLESLQGNSGSEVNDQLEQELTRSNQEVEKLEMQVKILEEQMTSMRSKFRKKVRAANMEVTEAKQESSLKIYRLKDEIKQLEEENLKLTERLERANAGSSPSAESGKLHPGRDQPVTEDSRMMVILELSGKVSSQEDHIQELTALIEEKDKLLKDLSDQLAQHRPPSRPPSEVHTSRPPSGSSNRPLSGKTSRQRSSGSSAKTNSNRDGQLIAHRGADPLDSDGGEETFRSSETDVFDYRKEEHRGRCKRKSEHDGREGRDNAEDDGKTPAGKGQISSEDRRKSGSRKNKDRVRTNSKDRKDPNKRIEDQGGEVDAESISSVSRDHGQVLGQKSSSPNSVSDQCSNSRVTHTPMSSRSTKRANSAGSEDSAFHENGEGTKSAPSSAGSSRLRRRLKSSQQRAASIDTLHSQCVDFPKPPSRTSANLYEQDSGLDDSCANQASKQISNPSDQDLDNLLQELMRESPMDAVQDIKEKRVQKFGISEDKIRSLISDGGS